MLMSIDLSDCGVRSGKSDLDLVEDDRVVST